MYQCPSTPIVVKKYGGSSVADESRLHDVATAVAASHAQHPQQVIVVSAMGNTTNRLLEQAGRVNQDASLRELDLLLATGEQQSASLLSMSLQRLGIDAVALTGPQAGVRTCSAHLNARIDRIDPQAILAQLARGKVVVVAGFQGLSPEGELTTLGRGGSDTTAVAIAAGLRARVCEIYSDVDGVYSADPRVVPEASRLDWIGGAEMKALAHHGAVVLNERAIDCAMRHDMPIQARCSRGRPGGTEVRPRHAGGARVVGIAARRRLLALRLDAAGRLPALRQRLAEYEHFLPESAWRQAQRVLLPSGQLSDEGALAEQLRNEFGADLQVRTDLGSVSVVGGRQQAGSDHGSRARQLLDEAGIAVEAMLDCGQAQCLLLPREAVDEATRCLHGLLAVGRTEVAHVA